MLNRTGLTLLELLVAVTVASLVIMVAHRVCAGVIDGTARTSDAWEELHHDANARRLLTDLVGSADVGPTQFDAFAGTSDHVAFIAWHVDSRGLAARRRIRVGAENGTLVVDGLYEAPLRLMGNLDHLSVEYLIELGAEAPWVRNWTSSASLPRAIRMRVARRGSVDTLLLTVGQRG